MQGTEALVRTLSAGPQASRDLFRSLIVWEGEHFQFGGGPIIPLSHTREVQAHAFVGPLPEVSKNLSKACPLLLCVLGVLWW